MKIIITYKEDSQRCKRKNLREFHEGESILDITIDQFSGHDVILASIPSETTSSIAKRHNCKTIDLNKKDEGLSELYYEFSSKLDADNEEPICYWTPTEVTYFINNDISDFINFGIEKLKRGKTTMLVRQTRHFFVDEYFSPENFNPGPWHPYSQHLRPKYIVGWASITTKGHMQKNKYCWGPFSEAYVAKEPYVDIDTEEEFKMAKVLWKHYV